MDSPYPHRDNHLSDPDTLEDCPGCVYEEGYQDGVEKGVLTMDLSTLKYAVKDVESGQILAAFKYYVHAVYWAREIYGGSEVKLESIADITSATQPTLGATNGGD